MPMTTPAQNVTRVQPFSTSQTRYTADGKVNSTDNTPTQVQVQRRIRPTSVSSPVRSDKTRQPRGWLSQWSHGAPPQGIVHCKYTPSSPTSHYGVTTGCCSPGLVYDMNLALGDQLLRNTVLSALAKVSESHMQLSAAMAQMGGTVNLARDFAREATHRLDKMMGGKKGLFNRLGRMSKWKNIPDEYLAYLYGVAPLADDLTNAFDYLYSLKDLGYDLTVVLKARKRLRESTQNRLISVRNGSSGFGQADVQGTRLIETACGFRFDLPRDIFGDKPTLSPWSTAYELTRMSFVLDWFVPVGDWLGSLEAAQWSPYFREGWTSKFVSESYDYRNAIARPSVPRFSLGMGGEFKQGFSTRSLVATFPYTITAPPAIKPLPGLQQAAQASALLTQAFKRWR